MSGQLPVTAIFGATGFIGRNLLAEFSKNNPKTVGAARKTGNGLLSLDLLKPDISPLRLKQRGVTHAVIAAAVSGIAACEEDPVLTRKANVQGTVELARQLCGLGIKVIVFSSDYVFDGAKGGYAEASPVSPVNEYGRQKAEMEKLVGESCGQRALIIRLSKVFDMIRGSGTLLDEMAGLLTRGEKVLAAEDQFFCPTYVGDVVDVISRLLVTDASGLMHLCAPTKISRFELARSVAETFGIGTELVKSISLRDLGENFVRPLDTSMVCDRLGRYVKHDFRDVRDCVKELRDNYQAKVHEYEK